MRTKPEGGSTAGNMGGSRFRVNRGSHPQSPLLHTPKDRESGLLGRIRVDVLSELCAAPKREFQTSQRVCTGKLDQLDRLARLDQLDLLVALFACNGSVIMDDPASCNREVFPGLILR